MPFGLKSAGNSFVRAAQTILHPIRDFSNSYVDDLSTFSDDFDGHLCHLKQFLTVVRSSGLTLNLKKCSFAKQETEMGYLVLVLVLKYIFYVLVLVLVLGCYVLVPIKKFFNC